VFDLLIEIAQFPQPSIHAWIGGSCFMGDYLAEVSAGNLRSASCHSANGRHPPDAAGNAHWRGMALGISLASIPSDIPCAYR
jgi:hypothetical protein